MRCINCITWFTSMALFHFCFTFLFHFCFTFLFHFCFTFFHFFSLFCFTFLFHCLTFVSLFCFTVSLLFHFHVTVPLMFCQFIDAKWRKICPSFYMHWKFLLFVWQGRDIYIYMIVWDKKQRTQAPGVKAFIYCNKNIFVAIQYE